MAARSKLFEPFAIGPLTLKNRIVMAPITTLYDVEGGDRCAAFLAERAMGGAGMITINLQALYPGPSGRSAAVPDYGEGRGPLSLNHDAHIPRLTALVNILHAHGCKVCAQLAVHGLWAPEGAGTPVVELSASGVRLQGPAYRPGIESLSLGNEGRPATVDELRRIQADIAGAAVRAVSAGFDALQLPCLGGNLFSRFLSPLTNLRTDEFGGSLVHRARMILETLRAIRAAVGDGVPLIVRVNGDDLLPGGMGPRDYQQLGPLLEAAGAHAFDVKPGWYETRQPVNQMSVPRGAFVYASAALRQAVRVPVSAGTRIADPDLAGRILLEGRADFIVLGTPLIADPWWPNKAREGRADDIRLCTACCACWSDLAGHRPVGCAINARAGRESIYRDGPARQQRHVVVIGGGPAGMEAARVAAARGHRVTLFEQGPELGGRLLWESVAPHKGEWRTFCAFLRSQLAAHGVRVRLDTRATPEAVEAERPGAVILATGARPARPAVPGIDLPQVAAWTDVLTNRVQAGRRVVVIGGGREGSETAEFLAAQGRTVTIAEAGSVVADDVDIWNRWVLLDRLAAAGIRILANARVESISHDGVAVEADGRPIEIVAADTVVYAVGSLPDDALRGGLDGRVPRVIAVGDCDAPAGIREAVDAGFRAGHGI